MIKPDDIEEEGHTKEWQDRARVVIDPEEDLKGKSSPHQSPTDDTEKDAATKSRQLREKNNENY